LDKNVSVPIKLDKGNLTKVENLLKEISKDMEKGESLNR
jgi:hypothetical protein